MKKEVNLINIFSLFLYIGTILIGGGYVVLPLLQTYLVEKHGWITDDELLNFYALSQALPGLIVINISIYIGYKLKGVFGAMSAVLGVTFSAFWSIVILTSILFNPNIFSNLSYGFKCIEISVILLIFLSIKEMYPKSIKNLTSFFIFLSALILLFFKFSPIQVILISTFIGSILYLINCKENDKCI